MSSLEPVKDILMRRDRCSEMEAEERILFFHSDLKELLEREGNLSDAEELVKDHFGLEPDYLMQFIG